MRTLLSFLVVFAIVFSLMMLAWPELLRQVNFLLGTL